MQKSEVNRVQNEEGSVTFACDSAALVLRREGGWSVEWAWGRRGDAVGQRFSPQQAVHVEQAIRERRAVAVSDCSAGEGRRCGMCEYWPARAALTVPLIVAHSPIGCLSFLPYSEVTSG